MRVHLPTDSLILLRGRRLLQRDDAIAVIPVMQWLILVNVFKNQKRRRKKGDWKREGVNIKELDKNNNTNNIVIKNKNI